jgi:hypothetical protein
MQVLPPKQDAGKQCYEFTFLNAPVIDCSNATLIPFSVEPTLQAGLQAFVQDFLRGSAKYFSKQMTESVFYQRLTHVWGTEGTAVVPGKEIQRATWTPARIHIYPTQYQVHWVLVGVDYVPEPTIPPGFLERDELVSDESIGVIQGTDEIHDELPGQPLGALDEEAIPLSSRFTQAERMERAAKRQQIRQARLRVALAQLKAERLAERYYRRYGDFEAVDDSDSELSEEEDAARLLREALADEGDSE